MKLIVFFSWQSDIDTNKLHNKNFLCECINCAIKNIENKGQLKNIFFEFQESTSNIPGNPPISRILDNRIANCDIFIADLSITDSYSCLEMFIRRWRKVKTKREPNNNVYGEYNKALANHSDEQIITIMNTINGVPQKDNSLIPFDTRERRFPLNYYLKSDKDNENVKSKVVSILEKAIRESALAAVENKEKKYLPFIRFNEFKTQNRNRGGYIQTVELEQIQKQLFENKGNIRLLGLSGIGKTRLVQETFERKQENVNFLYCNCYTNEESSVISATNRIFERFSEAIVVIDNCRKELFEKIIVEKNSHRASNPIIAIYHDVNESNINETNKITLQRKQQSIVEGIVDRYNQYYKPEQRERLIEFSGGIPLIAIRLCKSLQEGNPIGVFNDETLLSKLLGTDTNSTERKMLRSLSLFDFIGAFEEARIEMSFVANNKDITPIEGSTEVIMNNFDSLINKSIEREIMERNGRFVAIRPKPIGLQLTSEWISDCSSERLLRVVKAIQESDCAKSLTESFSQHFKYMQHDEKAVLILESLLQPNSPFHNAEVINTDLGSRLFRSFVEVNPIAVADCLWSVFGCMTSEQLKQIDEGRRNLIWTLDKICFDARTYEKGMKLMLMFGTAENEKWSNNATNEFIHLFNIYLPGTQASLSERLEILKWGSNHESYKTLIIKAINSALATNYFTYMGGAENQGTKQLEHYQPKSREEIYEYWTECINIIYTEIINDTIYSDLCSSILTKCVSILCKAGASHIVLPIVKEICNKKRNDWDDMLDSLWLTKTHISYNIESKWQIFIDNLISLLTKNDFVSRFKSVENRFRNPEDNVSFEKRLEKNKNQYEILAKEYVNKWMNDTSILLGLYQIENCFTNPFGYIVAKLNEQNTENVYWFIEKSIECFHSLEKFNPSILYDFAKGLNKDNFDHLVSELYKDRKCSFLLFPIIANRGTALSETQLLFKLVERRDVSANNFLDFWRYSTIIRTSSDSEIITFFSKIINCDKDNGFNVIITMTKNLMFFNKERKFDTIADFITSEFESRKISPKSFMQNNDYLEVIEILLKICNNPQLAIFINKIIIEVSNNPGSNISNDWRIEHIYSILFDKYFKDISQDLFSALSSENLFSELAFQFLLSPKDFSDLSHKLFQQNNIDIILNYCKQSPIAQERIMRIIPAITQDGKFSPLVMELLDNFGNNTEILNSLSSNLLSFSAVGSLIPVYKNRKETFSTLLNHSNPIIADWAQMNINQLEKEIEAEEKREAENKLLYS